jgi:hypothetical protein
MKHDQCDTHKNRKGKEKPIRRFGMDVKVIFKQIVDKTICDDVDWIHLVLKTASENIFEQGVESFLMQNAGNSLIKWLNIGFL